MPERKRTYQSVPIFAYADDLNKTMIKEKHGKHKGTTILIPLRLYMYINQIWRISTVYKITFQTATHVHSLSPKEETEL
jgi:hypothetical protein